MVLGKYYSVCALVYKVIEISLSVNEIIHVNTYTLKCSFVPYKLCFIHENYFYFNASYSHSHIIAKMKKRGDIFITKMVTKKYLFSFDYFKLICPIIDDNESF